MFFYSFLIYYCLSLVNEVMNKSIIASGVRSFYTILGYAYPLCFPLQTSH